MEGKKRATKGRGKSAGGSNSLSLRFAADMRGELLRSALGDVSAHAGRGLYADLVWIALDALRQAGALDDGWKVVDPSLLNSMLQRAKVVWAVSPNGELPSVAARPVQIGAASSALNVPAAESLVVANSGGRVVVDKTPDVRDVLPTPVATHLVADMVAQEGDVLPVAAIESVQVAAPIVSGAAVKAVSDERRNRLSGFLAGGQ